MLAAYLLATSAAASDPVVLASSSSELGCPPAHPETIVDEYWQNERSWRLHAETTAAVSGSVRAVQVFPTEYGSGEVAWGICVVESVTPHPESGFVERRRPTTYTRDYLMLWREGKVVALYGSVSIQDRAYTASGCALLRQ